MVTLSTTTETRTTKTTKSTSDPELDQALGSKQLKYSVAVAGDAWYDDFQYLPKAVRLGNDACHNRPL